MAAKKKRKVVSLSSERAKRGLNTSASDRRTLQALARDRLAVIERGAPERWSMRREAMNLRAAAGKLELESGIMGPPIGLTLFATIMHKLAEGRATIDTAGADWDGIVRALDFGCSGDQLRKLWRIFEWLHLLPGKHMDVPAWTVVDETYKAVTGTQSKDAARLRVLQEVTTAVEWVHMQSRAWLIMRSSLTPERFEEVAPAMRQSAATMLIEALSEVDARFGQLDGGLVFRLISATRPPGEANRGGAGNGRPALCAARLSRAARVFDDHKVSEEKAKRRYLAAKPSVHS